MRITKEVTVFGATFEASGDVYSGCSGTEYAPSTPDTFELDSVQIDGQELIELLREDIINRIEEEINYNL